ncbi:hypothetical protein PHJA_002466800 [Phtheirospermum japonicum]|uniref:Uncharacterized protein n=1 Tax=Phtheirospermum japonicum TaxID=374723 RepID=A0A830CW68_9LAMI|nr:hypothetical protein PHJA_002466800 [Phtheirospermum japonicum]
MLLAEASMSTQRRRYLLKRRCRRTYVNATSTQLAEASMLTHTVDVPAQPMRAPGSTDVEHQHASVDAPSTRRPRIGNFRSDLVGQLFEYDDDKDPDLVVRFCKDIETRSQPNNQHADKLMALKPPTLHRSWKKRRKKGYVDFGRFDKFNHFIASSGDANFVQVFGRLLFVSSLKFEMIEINQLSYHIVPKTTKAYASRRASERFGGNRFEAAASDPHVGNVRLDSDAP